MKRAKQTFFGSRKVSRQRRHNQKSGGNRKSFSPRMEGLEDRKLLTTFTVTTRLDGPDVEGSL